MASACRSILLYVLLLGAGMRLLAATPAETRAFQAAEKEFQDSFYQQADRDFADFIQKYPSSQHLPEAFLYQAEARIRLANYAGALEVLAAHQGQAGKLADEYLFWQGEASFQKGDPRAAAESFARLLQQFPASPRRLEAVVREATARASLSEWARVIDLLQKTNGVFQAELSNPTNEFVQRGLLLLSEGHLRQGTGVQAEQVLQPLTNVVLPAQLDWQRYYLMSRVKLAAGQREDALQNTTNLVALAKTAGNPGLQAETAALRGEILEGLGRPKEALSAYQENLRPEVPADRQLQALVKTTDLLVGENRLAEAAEALEKFLGGNSSANSADFALLTLGELRLRQYEAGVTNAVSGVHGTTNCLQQAMAAFATFTNQCPQSPRFGKAQLDLGWCYWLDGKAAESAGALQVALERVTESVGAFQAALERLPVSVDQARAYFKLADAQCQQANLDAQYRQTNYPAAISNYNIVLDRFGQFPELKTNLFELALYQIVRAGVASGNLPAATNAVAKLLAWYPAGPHTDRAALIAGQELGRTRPELARNLFAEVTQASPQAPLLPEIQLAIAGTFEQENKWTEAIDQYNRWLDTFTNHPARPRAQYFRARANSQAGFQTNALNQFTNLLATFHASQFAQLARWWIADYYFQLGKFQEAEENYQACYVNTNWPASLLTYQACMMAGRAAYARQGWNDARLYYFTPLANNTNCPPEIRAQAFFALGDTLIVMGQDSTNKIGDYQEALRAFDQIGRLCPSNPIAVLAWGAKANCLLQWAQNSHDYGPATNAFQQVIDSPLADPAARATAKVGLGVTMEKMAQQTTGTNQTALLNAALEQYLSVFYYEKLLRDGETPDPFWTRKAGLEAARVAEGLNQRAQAISVLERLQTLFPPLRLERKINSLKVQEQTPRQPPKPT